MVCGFGAWGCVALGGALGSVARVGLISLIGSKHTPWGVALVNVLGSFAFAVVLSLSIRPITFELPLKALMLSGFMGAFTTFSTFTFEAYQMVQAGAWATCCIYVVLNVLGSLSAFFLGLWLVGYTPA
jgi:CrcB protein